MSQTGARAPLDKRYQADIREAVWDAIVKATTDPETRRADIRNEDIIEALAGLQAVLLSASEEAKSSLNLRSWAEEFAKRLRTKAAEAKERNEAQELFRKIIRK
jgi:hypothetical protein